MKDGADILTGSEYEIAGPELVAIRKIVTQLAKAIECGDYRLWIGAMDLEDDLAKEAQKTWFDGYICRYRPLSSELKLLAAAQKAGTITMECRLSLSYESFDPVEEIYCYTLQNPAGGWRITWFEKRPMPLSFELPYSHGPFNFNRSVSSEAGAWWDNQLWLGLAGQAADPLPPALYARAIPRNVRFREAHPLLEPAAQLANLLSIKTAELAFQIYDTAKIRVLGNLYYAAGESVQVRLVRPDRNNSWTSKYLAPWYGVDELIALKKSDPVMVGSCYAVMSLYFALLRLNGFGPREIWQLRVQNQDVLIINLNRELYLFSSEKLVKLSANTLYYNCEVSKIFNDHWIWTAAGFSNFPELLRRRIVARLREAAPIIRFPDGNPEKIIPFSTVPADALPNLETVADWREMNRLIKTKVLQLSVKYPDSAYTWAKYAYQTLYVPFPEVYAIWSLQSPLIPDLIRQCPTLEELFCYLDRLENGSVFAESDRIMTADQVIRHRKGDSKSRALLIYTWQKQKENRKAAVILTAQSAYCGWETADGWRYFDAGLQKQVPRPMGRPVLAFDNQSGFHPLINRKDERANAYWLELFKTS
jgi:hypothetical protein